MKFLSSSEHGIIVNLAHVKSITITRGDPVSHVSVNYVDGSDNIIFASTNVDDVEDILDEIAIFLNNTPELKESDDDWKAKDCLEII